MPDLVLCESPENPITGRCTVLSGDLPADPHTGLDPHADLDRLGDAIAQLSAHIQAATYRLLVLIREFDARAGWDSGFHSCAHWLNWRTGLDLGAAREKVRVAKALEDLSEISAAMQRGELSYSKVRALTRVATPENETELLQFAMTGTAAHVERLVRAWRRVDRFAVMECGEQLDQHRYLQTYTDEVGMVVVSARLTPEVGAVFAKALEAAMEKLYQRTRESSVEMPAKTPVGQRRADALELLAESALAGGLDPGTAGDRYQVVVHVQDETLRSGELDTGLDVSAETSRRLACECSRVVMTHGPDGDLLDVGRKTRTVHPAMRRALKHRDGGCRFPGCETQRCDAHHVEHWADGGRTDLDNLLLLCRFHHRALHEGGFRVEVDTHGVSKFYSPAGWVLPEAPAAPPFEGDRAVALERVHRLDGLVIDGETGFPLWQGEPLHLNQAIDALREDLGGEPAVPI